MVLLLKSTTSKPSAKGLARSLIKSLFQEECATPTIYGFYTHHLDSLVRDPHTRLPARNSLVNKVEFLGLVPQKW